MKEFIEKLIGRLEECQERYEDIAFMELGNRGHTFDYEFAEGKKEAMGEAIENVNRLAEEYNNDVCEWKGIDMLGLYNSSCQQKSIVNPFWTHCPYCGKKIKVVE